MKKDKKPMSFKKAMGINSRVFRMFFDKCPKMMISRVVRLIWSALTPYVGIYLSALVIGELSGGRDPERLKFLVLAALTSSALIALGSALIGRWEYKYNAANWYEIERIYTDKLLGMDFQDIDDPKTAEKLSTIRENSNGGGWGLYRVLGNFDALLRSILTIFGGISLTVTLFTSKVPESAGGYTVLNNPLFILLVIAVMLTVTYISPTLSTRGSSYFAKSAGDHNLANRLFGFFGFLGYNNRIATDVRIYRQDIICEKHIVDKTGTFSSKGPFARLSRGVIGFYSAASAAVSVIFTGFVYVFVCLKAWAGAFGLGAVTQYVSAVTKVSGSVSSLIGTLGDMRNNAAFLELVFEFLDIPNRMYQGSLTVEKRRDRKYEIEFRDVSFKYPGSENYSLRHVNIKFEVGKRLAVVGMNGSGKTTFIKLLCRLYDPTEGVILLNGIDIRKYDYREYMSVFSVVFQDYRLFSLKLGENVAGCTAYDKSRVLDSLGKAGFSGRLSELKNGVDTYLYKDFDNDGVNISGGEGQKIAIARSLYKDAPFIILDEPTAALDPVAEAEIYSKFNEIAGDKTAIYISHRLSSCKFCDEIAVFDSGAVVEFGTHDSLVAKVGGKYHELWHAQAQYYTAPVKEREHSPSVL